MNRNLKPDATPLRLDHSITGSTNGNKTSTRTQAPETIACHAELLPKLVLIGYAQSGKCNERQASNYADSSVFIRSDNQVVKFKINGGLEAKVRGSNRLGRAILRMAASDERRTTGLRSNGSSYSELNEQLIACQGT